jgi:hypothetical protein
MTYDGAAFRPNPNHDARSYDQWSFSTLPTGRLGDQLESLKRFVTGDWQTAKQIARAAGLNPARAVTQLRLLCNCREVESKADLTDQQTNKRNVYRLRVAP